jgi:ribose 5-phosphate isomerase B
VHFSPRYTPQDQDFRDGMILTFKANSPNYSYVQKSADGYLTRTAEKEVISREASVGVYCFDSIKNFYDAAAPYIASCKKSGRESHICPLYNEYISAGKKIISREIDDIHIMGTPDEFQFFEKVSFKFLSKQQRKFVLCSDHSGFRAKEMFIEFLDRKLDCQYIDIGTFSANDCDYNDYVSEACRIITTGKENYFGVGFCRSGQGVNIAANKHPGIRSCLVTNPEEIRLAIQHNACIFFAIPDRIIMDEKSPEYKKDKAMIYLLYEMGTARFSGGRHQNRLMKNKDY